LGDDANDSGKAQIEEHELHDYLLLKLKARSIDEPAEPENWPFRLKNEVVPFELLTADPVNCPLRSVYVCVRP